MQQMGNVPFTVLTRSTVFARGRVCVRANMEARFSLFIFGKFIFLVSVILEK
jgi:hypothetical protein